MAEVSDTYYYSTWAGEGGLLHAELHAVHPLQWLLRMQKAQEKSERLQRKALAERAGSSVWYHNLALFSDPLPLPTLVFWSTITREEAVIAANVMRLPGLPKSDGTYEDA